MKPVNLEFIFIPAISTSKIIPKHQFQVFAAKNQIKQIFIMSSRYRRMNTRICEVQNLWNSAVCYKAWQHQRIHREWFCWSLFKYAGPEKTKPDFAVLNVVLSIKQIVV